MKWVLVVALLLAVPALADWRWEGREDVRAAMAEARRARAEARANWRRLAGKCGTKCVRRIANGTVSSATLRWIGLVKCARLGRKCGKKCARSARICARPSARVASHSQAIAPDRKEHTSEL